MGCDYSFCVVGSSSCKQDFAVAIAWLLLSHPWAQPVVQQGQDAGGNPGLWHSAVFCATWLCPKISYVARLQTQPENLNSDCQEKAPCERAADWKGDYFV